jgi:hypothetical protein
MRAVHNRRPRDRRNGIAMGFPGIFARFVAMVGAAAILWRRADGGPSEPALGAAPVIPPGKPQRIPTLKMPTARGWAKGQTPVAAPGLSVNAFAAGLKHPPHGRYCSFLLGAWPPDGPRHARKTIR